jgi:hypothetical protein
VDVTVKIRYDADFQRFPPIQQFPAIARGRWIWRHCPPVCKLRPTPKRGTPPG